MTFWQTLSAKFIFNSTQIHLQFNTAYHSQIYGRTEVANRSLKSLLRSSMKKNIQIEILFSHEMNLLS